MAFFVAHVPTLLTMIVVSSLMMAASMAVVGKGRRDGLGCWAAALLVNAIAHLLLMLRGQVPDVLSVVVGNLLLSCALAGLIAAIYQFQGRPVRWLWLSVPPVLIAGLVMVFIDSFSARVGFVGLLLGLQATWALVAVLERRHAIVGRGLWLLAGGLGLDALVLGVRALLAVSMPGAVTSMLQGSAVQTLTFLGSFSVVLMVLSLHSKA